MEDVAWKLSLDGHRAFQSHARGPRAPGQQKNVPEGAWCGSHGPADTVPGMWPSARGWETERQAGEFGPGRRVLGSPCKQQQLLVLC